MRFLPTLTLAPWFLLGCSSLRAQDPPQSPTQEPTPNIADAPKPSRIRIAGNVAAAQIMHRVQPIYPPLARQTRISGTVRLHVVLSTEGIVKSIEVVSGHPLLLQSALDAVRQWRYQPTLLSGTPIEVDTTVDVIYALADGPAAPAPAAGLYTQLPVDDGVDPQLRADILRLFEAMHFKENATKGGRQIFESLRPALMASLPPTPGRERITDAYIDKLLALLQSDSYTDRVIAIYVKYFSDEDVQELSRFYQTPAGQHFNAVLPQLLGDLNAIGQKLAMDNLPSIFRQLCKEFPELQDDARFCKEPDPQKKSQLNAPRPDLAAGVLNSEAQK